MVSGIQHPRPSPLFSSCSLATSPPIFLPLAAHVRSFIIILALVFADAFFTAMQLYRTSLLLFRFAISPFKTEKQNWTVDCAPIGKDLTRTSSPLFISFVSRGLLSSERAAFPLLRSTVTNITTNHNFDCS